MITVEGTDQDGTAYAVCFSAPESEVLAAGLAMPASFGDNVHGTTSIVAALEVDDGAPVLLTPTGPSAVLRSSDPVSVLAWLHANTTVDSIEPGLPPMPEGPDDAGVIY